MTTRTRTRIKKNTRANKLYVSIHQIKLFTQAALALLLPASFTNYSSHLRTFISEFCDLCSIVVTVSIHKIATQTHDTHVQKAAKVLKTSQREI